MTKPTSQRNDAILNDIDKLRIHEQCYVDLLPNESITSLRRVLDWHKSRRFGGKVIRIIGYRNIVYFLRVQ